MAKRALRSRISAAAGTPIFASYGFADFYKEHFRELVRAAMYAGATRTEADDAIQKAMAEMYPRWTQRTYTVAYARKAVIRNFIKDKTRGPGLTAQRLRERGHVPRQEGADDPGLSRLEDDEWIHSVLSCLSPAQREVMELFARGLSVGEIAAELGKNTQTIRKHVSDACKRLRTELNPDGEHKHQRGRREAR